MKRYFLFLAFFPLALSASPAKLKALYNSLDPLSVSEHFAFYELYKDTSQGTEALNQALKLLAGTSQAPSQGFKQFPDFFNSLDAIVRLVNKQPLEEIEPLDDQALKLIEELANRLPNRKLKGKWALTEEEVLKLSAEEIDVARALFLTQFGATPAAIRKTKSYEAMIDLMALQILAKLQGERSPEKMIRAINDYIFFELGYRFPPHSLYAKDIDVYTFLPSVLDSRRGVCLGVSILYICLAQRLDLPLEMITPPGHIYVRYRNGTDIINIETTARGIDIDSKHYLSIDTRSLQQRTAKEVVGLAHFNEASVYLQSGDYEKAAASYERALKYTPDDMLTKEFLGYAYLFSGKKEAGVGLLKEVRHYLPDFSVSADTMADDYLSGLVDADGIKPLFLSVDETQESIIEKRTILEETVKKYPRFKAGYFHLASAWLQLHREREALEALKIYHQLDPNDATAEYYLAVIHMERMQYAKAWEHLRQAEKLVFSRGHHPRALEDLRKELASISPE